MFVVSLCFAWQQSCVAIDRPGTAGKKDASEMFSSTSMYITQLNLSIISWTVEGKINMNLLIQIASRVTADCNLKYVNPNKVIVTMKVRVIINAVQMT